MIGRKCGFMIISVCTWVYYVDDNGFNESVN